MLYKRCVGLCFVSLGKGKVKALICTYKNIAIILLSIPLLMISTRLWAENSYRLPPAQLPQNNHSLATINKIKVKQFVIEGNSVFSDEQLGKLTQPYLNQWLSIEQLMELKDKLTHFYVDKGYINSGATLPDQEVKSAIIRFKIIEGRLNTIHVQGNPNIATDYLTAKINDLNEQQQAALNLFTLQKSLKLLEQSPLIEKVDAQLSPGLLPGQSNLDVKVDEAKAYELNFKLNNHRSPSIGAEVGEIEARHINLFGHGESFYLNYGFLDKKDDYLIHFSTPLITHKTTAAVSIERDSSVVLTEPFNSLGFSSDLKRFSTSISHRFKHSLSQEITFGAEYSLSQSETQLLGQPFAFPPGVAKARVNELSLLVNWVERNKQNVLAMNSELGFGLPVGNATKRKNDLPDGQFVRWRGQFQWLHSLPFWSAESLLRLNMQLSNHNLLSINQFAMGGVNTVRGYRENVLVRDNGIVASLQAHIPIAQLILPGIVSPGKSDTSQLQLVPFIDYAYAWNRHDFLLEPEKIYSLGLGLVWKMAKRFSAEVYWAKALKKTAIDYDSNLQDKGFHIQLTLHVL